jgi:hypothetical protein
VARRFRIGWPLAGATIASSRRRVGLGTLCLAALAALSLWIEPPASAEEDRVIAWSGQQWRVRPAAWDGLPGPNRWSAGNVFVSGSALKLSITPSGRGWLCAEVESLATFGYGRYEFTVASDLSRLDPSVVLGLFTYGSALPAPHNEIDFEATRWNSPTDPNNGQFAQQPFARRGHLKRFKLSRRAPYKIWWEWRPGLIAAGITDAAGKKLGSYLAPTKFKPAGEHVLINLWLSRGRAPAAPVTIELTGFEFRPLAAVRRR